MSAKSIFKNPLQFLGLEETQKIPEEKEHSGGRPSGASATSSSSGVFRVPPSPDNILDPVPPDACIRDIPTVNEVDTNSSSDSDETSSTTSDGESANEVKPISPSKVAENLGNLHQREAFLSEREKALVKKEEAFKQIEQVSEEAFQKKIQASEEAFHQKVQASEEAFKRRKDALGEQEKQLATQRSDLLKESDRLTTARLELINYVQSSLAQFSQAGGQFINSLMTSSHQGVTTPEATQPPQQVLPTPVVQPPTPEVRRAEKEKRHRERKEERKRAKLNKN